MGQKKKNKGKKYKLKFKKSDFIGPTGADGAPGSSNLEAFTVRQILPDIPLGPNFTPLIYFADGPTVGVTNTDTSTIINPGQDGVYIINYILQVDKVTGFIAEIRVGDSLKKTKLHNGVNEIIDTWYVSLAAGDEVTVTARTTDSSLTNPFGVFNLRKIGTSPLP